MKGSLSIIPLICVALLTLSIFALRVSADVEPELQQGGFDRPSVESVEASLTNSTGFFRLNFLAVGSAPEGTEGLEVTFGTLNGTEIEVDEGSWITEEDNFYFLGNKIFIEKDGNTTEPWSRWNFEIAFAVTSTGGIESAVQTIGGIFNLGIDLGNISMEDLNVTMENVTEAMAEMQIYFIARAYNETGAWGQDAFDITPHVQTALLSFLIEEGLIDGELPVDDDDIEPSDDDEDPDDDDGKDLSTALVIGLTITGAVFLLTVIAIVVSIVLKNKGNQ